MEIVVSDTQILIDMHSAGLLELVSKSDLLDVNPRLPKKDFLDRIKAMRGFGNLAR